MKIRAMVMLVGLGLTVNVQELVAQEAIAKPTATAVVTPVPAQKPATNPAAVRAARPMSVTVVLDKDTKLTGTLMDTRELPMRTAFGALQIPLSEVAGIRMAHEGNATTTVVLHNGDSVTGATDLKLLMVETQWGKAEINGSNIESILFVPGMSWVADAGLNGNRWKLADSNSGKPITVAKPAVNGSTISPRPIGSPQPSFQGQPISNGQFFQGQ